jgi:hypothetical protein
MNRSIYLIRRGPRPEHYHPDTPHHPAVVCDSGKVARLAAGDSSDCATVWQHFGWAADGSGLLLIRWKGLDLDYGHAVRGFTLPDGTHTGFYHEGSGSEVWGLFLGAIWWSSRPLPKWLDERGVSVVPDSLTGPIDRRTYDEIRVDEARARDPDDRVLSIGYRYTLDLPESDRKARSDVERLLPIFDE